ncbi:dephospho-CoA kinase [Muriicola sp. Z0-33]|uniref:dephospho-CoA kinase n=1 Tax=Muriicola sp. Z0-33 TaxID=2816957 RepID=UPI002238E434|nr:dephospho-CoA kinase [Muriicola sp. Z0-33]MCW5516544.1 dephospho-CoA kinase [Muriicola sp. Z0-33]
MMIVGLTGGIGSGKSTVAGYFKELGVPVYNSDKQAKKLMRNSKKLRKAIIKLLGEDAYIGKKLNRSVIAQKVFNNKELLEGLNHLVHPAVKQHFLKWARKQESNYVIQEAALLFENGSYKNYDKMILVRAPLSQRIARLLERDGSSESEIMARIKHQWSDEEKSALSDYLIDNIDLEKTRSEVALIHRELLKISG